MSRAALRRAYKETRRPMGVYRVRNTRTDRSLVARSVDLPASLNRERAQLRFGGHPNTELQRDWNASGPEAFVFEVLDTLAPRDDQPGYDPTDDLRVLEALWLERLAPFGDRGYVPPRASRA
jgi:hypothetical protein